MFPFVSLGVHLEGIERKHSLKVILLGKVVLSDCGIMLGNLLVEGPGDFRSLVS